MSYTPKYISVDEIPVQIPDDYSQSEKIDAIELAESLIEIELADGGSLDTVTSVHEAAIKQRATCELAKAAEDPDDVSISDLNDDGSTKSEYAQDAFCRHYHELVGKIRSFKESDDTGTFYYGTSKSEDRIEWDRLEKQIDVDWDDDFARRTDYV